MRSAFEKGLQADRLLQQAAKLEGEARLQPLLAAWQLIPEELRKLNKPLQQEILALDTQDLSGLRAEAAAKQALKECMAAEAAAPTEAAALDIVNAALAQAVPANRRQLLELKYRLLMRGLETHEDVYAAAEVAYAAIDADLRLTPRQKENRKRQLRAVFANPPDRPQPQQNLPPQQTQKITRLRHRAKKIPHFAKKSLQYDYKRATIPPHSFRVNQKAQLAQW
ncbi:MAG: hypothetical protein Q4F40_10515 [Akkermansia sp.]|nr:hypothetical protein [Akkermansia sp.]